MKNLLLTLGHNSSAILVENNEIVWGYETERVTGVKSDSRFPQAVLDHVAKFRPDMVYVTHWAPNGALSSMSSKHWDASQFDGIPIRTLSPDCTHHDTHMAAAMCYAGPSFPRNGSYGLVIDGFGTYGEHLSIYYLDGPVPKLIRRVHGYETSLGLWYQYATAFMGMKMHEDEYKLLGYEVHIDSATREVIEVEAKDRAMRMLDKMIQSVYGSKYDPVYDLSALANVKATIFEHLTEFCHKLGVTDPSSFSGRVIVAYYVQAVLEKVVLTLIEGLRATNLVLSGGCFYNVKLNKRLLHAIDGKICVYPLAGDQGNAIGLYAIDHPEFTFPQDLNWGKRELKNVGSVPNLYVVDEELALEMVSQTLRHVGYVNLVRDNMEFGPRAMCNTSTLAIPTSNNVAEINLMNDRNTVMPMAPVMTQAMYKAKFERTDQVWRSHHHMVIAMEYQEYPEINQRGVAHEYHFPHHHHTGRPQVVQNDRFMDILLNRMGHPLINTSFNFHGKPIALDMPSIIDNHMMQYQRCNNIHTVVIKNA